MDETIPALSLRQPWAWAIFHAGKTIENRKWATKYRGRIRIHASKTWDREGWNWLMEHGAIPPVHSQLLDAVQMGSYVGEVTVAYCIQLHRLSSVAWHEEHDPWAFGPVCWVLENAIAYPHPIPGRGYPGLYLPERFSAARMSQ